MDLRTALQAAASALLLSLVVLLANEIVSAPEAASARARERGIRRAEPGPYAVRVMRGDTSCRAAGRILVRYSRSDAPCEGSACFREIQRVDVRYRSRILGAAAVELRAGAARSRRILHRRLGRRLGPWPRSRLERSLG